MKTTAMLLTGIIFMANGYASEELAQSSNCLACHRIDSQLVGPSLQSVAAKYKEQDGASEMLLESVKNGSTGKWGAIPMPANAAVSDEDIQTLVDWVLAM